MRVHPAKDARATYVLAHGAGAGQSSEWIVRYAKALAKRGVRVVTFDFPGSRKNPPLIEAYRRVVADVLARFPHEPLSLGGKSMGGRIASMIVAEYTLPVRSLVFFGYPLHPPKKPETRRDAHLPDVKAPMFFISGTRDPFGSATEMRELTRKLGAKLMLVEGGDHSLGYDSTIWDEAATFILQSK